MTKLLHDKAYWGKAYDEDDTGWDIGSPSTPLKTYIDQLTNKDLRILIPGAGNAYEAGYLHNKGFTNVTVLDLTEQPLANLKKRCPSFPNDKLVLGNYFKHKGTYHLQLEQTFFCAIQPDLREAYAKQAHNLLAKGGKLVGVYFDRVRPDGPPYCDPAENYRPILEPYFDFLTYELCYNSIEPRKENEYFAILKRKN